ncbi:hypothetical protein ACFX16_023138 [Malus domestica]
MKNHNSRPTGLAPFPEVNVASPEWNTISSRGNNYKRGRGHKQDRWNGKGKNHGVQFHNQVPRCGGNGHWARTCRTPKHLVDMYQASFKEKGVEINFFDQAQPMETPDPVTNLSGQHIDVSNDNPCKAYSQGKLVIRASQLKVDDESPSFLQRIQGDICGPIQPPCGPFRYFMVLVDASTRWSHVCLLSTRNVAFARLLAQIIKLRAQFPDHPIKSIRLDNVGEFMSQTFDDYYMALGIDVEHPVPHVHTQNGLAEAFIKRLQLIARTLLMKMKLPVYVWGHAILHAVSLVRLRPIANH